MAPRNPGRRPGNGPAPAPVRVYKLGGPALEDPGFVAPFAQEVKRACSRAVVVHGGGRHVERLLRALAIPFRFVDGRRETSPAAMEIVEMVLSAAVNKSLAAELSHAGIPSVGVSGRDGGMLQALPMSGLGRVGTSVCVDPTLVASLWSAGFVPVVSPVSSGPSGESLNVNADEAALALAAALGARSLVSLSDVDGVRLGGATIPELDEQEAERLIAEGAIEGGMVLKVRSAISAVRAGVPEVVIAGRARLAGGFAGTRIAARAAREERP
jgi:acetylglutamate kinase